MTAHDSGTDWEEAGRQHAYQDTMGDNPLKSNDIENWPTESQAAEAGWAPLAAWREGYKNGELEMQA